MERISRERMMMDIAVTVSKRSSCERKKVGAVIEREGRILSLGYAGAPSGSPHCHPDSCDLSLPCTRTIHAETNAIVWAAKEGISIKDSRLFVTLSPCLSCAKLIINSGITSVIYGEYYRDRSGLDLLKSQGISYIGLLI